MRYPDIPQEVDVSFLDRVDTHCAPGTYIAQEKLDGQRFIEEWADGEWLFWSKTAKAKREWPDDLKAEWSAFWKPVTDVVWQLRFDSEWTGPRQGAPSVVWVFDLLSYKDKWLGETAFQSRYVSLSEMYNGLLGSRKPGRIRLVPAHPNPGFVNLFYNQLANPLSEGIVVRRADSGLVGGFNSPTINPRWMKAKFETVNRVLHFQNGGQ